MFDSAINNSSIHNLNSSTTTDNQHYFDLGHIGDHDNQHYIDYNGDIDYQHYVGDIGNQHNFDFDHNNQHYVDLGTRWPRQPALRRLQQWHRPPALRRLQRWHQPPALRRLCRWHRPPALRRWHRQPAQLRLRPHLRWRRSIIKVWNWDMQLSWKIIINNLGCRGSTVSLIPSSSNLTQSLQFQRSQEFHISSYLQWTCDASFSTINTWAIKNCTGTCSDQIQIDPMIDWTLSELVVPARTLPLGTYELKSTVTIVTIPGMNLSASTYIKVNPSGPIVNLVRFGTSMITHARQKNFQIDPGQFSVDPDATSWETDVSERRWIRSRTRFILFRLEMGLQLLLSNLWSLRFSSDQRCLADNGWSSRSTLQFILSIQSDR